MNKLFLLLIILLLILNSCKKKVELEKYDKNGNLIVYSEDVYAKMWVKNRNLKVTVIDTFCINQKSKALKDIKNGKLIYFGFHPREFEKMTKIWLKKKSCGEIQKQITLRFNKTPWNLHLIV